MRPNSLASVLLQIGVLIVLGLTWRLIGYVSHKAGGVPVMFDLWIPVMIVIVVILPHVAQED